MERFCMESLRLSEHRLLLRLARLSLLQMESNSATVRKEWLVGSNPLKPHKGWSKAIPRLGRR